MYLITVGGLINELKKLPQDNYVSGVGIKSTNKCNMLDICGVDGETILEVPMRRIDLDKLRGLKQ